MIAVVVLMLILVPETIVAAPVQAQTVRATGILCQNATGSGSAEDSLSRLRVLGAAGQDAGATIAACESKAMALRQEEQQLWIRALDAKKNWDCSDGRRQFRTLVQRVSLYQVQAALELKRVGDCGEQLRTEESADLQLQHARTAYKARDFRAARERAWRLVSLKNSIGEAARALLLDIEQIEILNDILRSVEQLTKSGRLKQACGVMLRTQNAYPSAPNIADVTRRLGDCATVMADVPPLVPEVTEPPPDSGPRGNRGGGRGGRGAVTAKPKTELEKQLDAARLYIEEGNLELAVLRLEAASKMASPKDKNVAEVQDRYQSAKQARDLLDIGITLIYQAKYPEATKQLTYVINGGASAGLAARARFYTGIAKSHQYYLGGNGMDRTDAVEQFRNSVSGYSQPDFEQISPKIKQLYDEAVGN